MRSLFITSLFLGAIGIVLAGCQTHRKSSVASSDTQAFDRKLSQKRQIAAAAGETLTLDNVYMIHADIRSWEDGDVQFFFPEAGKGGHDYQRITGVKIDGSGSCRSFSVSNDGATDPRKVVYSISCKPLNGGASITMTTSSATFFETAETPIPLVTKFTFNDHVRLEKVNDSLYRLVVE